MQVSLYTTNLRGLASVNKEQIDSKTLEMVNAGDQLSLRMSRQIAPWLLILQ
jgi:hypothetical protein